MPDVLVRGLSEAAVRRLDEQAASLGLSRNEFLKRQLERDETPRVDIMFTPDDLVRASEATSDLLDDALMEQAWRGTAG